MKRTKPTFGSVGWGERSLVVQSVSWSSQLGATPLASDNEGYKRELIFFSHRERNSVKGKSSQVEKGKKRKERHREGKTVRRDGVGSGEKRKRNLRCRQ